MIELLIRWCVARRGFVLTVWAGLTGLAIFYATELRLDALPDITSNQVQVLTRAVGLSPDEVEMRVTRPLEVAIGGIPGIDHQRSISRSGLSAITVVFDEDVEPLVARQLVSERISGVRGELPENAQAELGPLTGGLGEVYHFSLDSSTKTGAELLELVKLRVAPLLRSVSGVVEVNTWGGNERSLDVHVDPTRLSSFGIGFSEVTGAVERAAGNLPAGALPSGQTQVALRNRSNPNTPFALGAQHLKTDAERALRIDDVATVLPGSRPRLGAATADGRGETVYVMVQMLSGANAREVTHAIREQMSEVRKVLPADVEINTLYDRSTLVDATIRTVALSLFEGGVLVCFVLFLFLGSFRAGLLVAATIPVAMAIALAVMARANVPGNLLSLGAIDFGLVVDGAVVLVEHVFHKRGSSERSFAERVTEACVEVGKPAFFGALIIGIVYVPILTLSGVDGKMFRPMAFTVVVALAAALLFAITFVPAAAAMLLREKDIPQRTPRVVRALEVSHSYLLNFMMARRALAIALSLAALVATFLLSQRTGTELTPQLDEGDLVIQTTRRADLSLDGAIQAATLMERTLKSFPEVTRVTSRIGSPAVATDTMGIEQADVFVQLKPKFEWRSGLSKEDLIRNMQEALEKAAPDSDPAFTQPIQMRFNELLAGAPSDVVISVYGDDLEILRKLATQFRDVVASEPGVSDARVLLPEDIPSLALEPNPTGAAQAGLSSQDILRMASALQFGLEVGHVYEGPLTIPIVMHLDSEVARSALNIPHQSLPSARGQPVPIQSLAEVRHELIPSIINHHDGSRRVLVGFNVRGRDLGTTVKAARARVQALKVPEGYRVGWGGQYEALEEARARLAIVIPLVLIAIIFVLYQAFQSLKVALIVLSHVPFACVGGIVLLWLRDMPLSFSAIVGFIALSGIAVMNGVVLMTEIVKLEKSGRSAADAAVLAARSRARPVFMTAFVASLGFVPMMIASGIGSEVQKPLATVVVGGLGTSTALTLLLLPVVYPLVRSFRKARTA